MPIYYDKMGLSIDELAQFITSRISVGLICGYLFYDSIFAGIAIFMLLMLTKDVYRKTLIEKHKNELLLQFRDLLYSISSSISSGRSMAQALEESIEFWKGTYGEKDYITIEVRQMVKRIREANEKDIDVLKDFADRSGLEDVCDFVTVYDTSRATGGNLPRAISRATDIIGDKISLERELKTMLAEKMFEGKIVTGAPFVLILFMKMMSADYMEVMYESSSGRICMTICLVIMAAAYYWIERINHIDV